MKRILITTTFLTLLALVATWGANRAVTVAIAAPDHAGHEHGHHESATGQAPEDLEALFADEDSEEHAGHEHDHKPSGQAAGHDDHAGHDHDGHGHGALDGICGEHNVDEAFCALCQGSHLGDLAPGQGMKVRLASPEVADKAGVRLTRPQPVALAAGLDIPGRVAFNRNQLAYITPLAAGVIRKVHVQPGSKVERGALLAEVAMPEVAGLKAEFRAARARQAQAEATYLREKDLLARGISSRQEFQQAESDFSTSQSATEQYRQQLLNFGLSAADLKQLQPGATIALRAPFSGVVTEVKTATGEAIAEGSALFTVANLDTLWIELAIPESEIYRAEAATAIQARFDGLPGTVFSGHLFQVGAVVDERTRTLSALAEVDNPGHRLKVGMFGRARLLAGTTSGGLAVPADAVQSIDGISFLFIQEEPDLFELRRVTTGPGQDGLVVISAGVTADDRVVAAQGFALKSEVLKARLGASCADH